MIHPRADVDGIHIPCKNGGSRLGQIEGPHTSAILYV